jgi:hypothetical protein
MPQVRPDLTSLIEHLQQLLRRQGSLRMLTEAEQAVAEDHLALQLGPNERQLRAALVLAGAHQAVDRRFIVGRQTDRLPVIFLALRDAAHLNLDQTADGERRRVRRIELR